MGIAMHNRGSKVIARELCRADRPVEFEIIEMLNELPKDQNVVRPFGPIDFVFGHGGCWATCPTTGFGYWFETLRAAVRHYDVTITGYSDDPEPRYIGELTEPAKVARST